MAVSYKETLNAARRESGTSTQAERDAAHEYARRRALWLRGEAPHPSFTLSEWIAVAAERAAEPPPTKRAKR